MPRPGILLLLSGGVALSAYVQLPPDSDVSRDLAEITRISAAPDRSQQSDEVIRSFAPANLASPVRERAVAAADVGESAPRAVALVRSGTWSTVVTSEPSAASPIRSSRAADSATRNQLAHDLQQELQRVGCYQGEITGTWNAATRRAMAAFMDRANSVLPYDQPDYVLLALVQSHQEIACAAECPAGQVQESGNRCVPRAVVAQAAKKSKRLEDRRIAEERLAANEPRQAASEPEVLPWLKHEAATLPPAQIAIAPRPNPLPGRMSIGGPQVEAVAAPEPLTSSLLPPVIAMPNNTAPDNAAANRGNKVAALQFDPDADDLSDDSGVIPDNSVPAAADATFEVPKQRKSRRSDKESRPRRDNTYASAGRRRHGDPRPGTARYNLMQSLGGIY